MSFVCSQHLRYIWQTVADLGFVCDGGVALRNCGGHQVTQNASFCFIDIVNFKSLYVQSNMFVLQNANFLHDVV